MENFDVVLTGGGTAGLILARELGKFKRKTLVLDRKKDLLEFSFNTLGSFLNLKEFGLTTDVVAQEIATISFYSNHIKRKVKSDSYILDKKKVQIEILNSIDHEYVDIITGVDIKSINHNKEGHFTAVIDKNNVSYFGEIFIDASGTNAVISKKVGLRAKKVDLASGVEYNVKYIGNPSEMHLLIGKIYQGGYGWIFPLKDNRAIIGFGTFDEKMVKELKQRLNKILDLPKIKKLVTKDNERVEGGSIPITPVLDKFIFEAAIIASRAIEKSLKNMDLKYLSEYEANWKKRFFLNYKRSKRSQARFFTYSQNNFLTDFIVFISKFLSDKRAIKSLSGEYGLDKV